MKNNTPTTCTVITYGPVSVTTTREAVDVLRERRIIEWNHAILAWQPAKDDANDRSVNWERVLDAVTAEDDTDGSD